MKKTIKNIGKGICAIVGGAVIGTVIGLGVYEYSTRNDLSPQDFEKGRWTRIYNGDGILWDNYIKADIHKNTHNYDLFLRKTDEKNNGKREGEILVPTEVGKNLNISEGEK